MVYLIKTSGVIFVIYPWSIELEGHIDSMLHKTRFMGPYGRNVIRTGITSYCLKIFRETFLVEFFQWFLILQTLEMILCWYTVNIIYGDLLHFPKLELENILLFLVFPQKSFFHQYFKYSSSPTTCVTVNIIKSAVCLNCCRRRKNNFPLFFLCGITFLWTLDGNFFLSRRVNESVICSRKICRNQLSLWFNFCVRLFDLFILIA